MLVVYPNQKIVTVHKAPANKENVYGVLNKAAAFSALQNLTHNELKVFMYLALNQPDYCMALSTSDIAAKVGSTEDGMRKAVQGLIKKGYMVQEHGRAYAFYENLETGLTESEKMNGEKVTVNSVPRATLARTFSHTLTGKQPHRHGGQPHPENSSIMISAHGIV